jgi:hypothetical protein
MVSILQYLPPKSNRVADLSRYMERTLAQLKLREDQTN